jgi:hypothetical protein
MRLGRHRWKVERSLAWLLANRRLTVRYERRADLLEAFLHLACALICARRLRPFETTPELEGGQAEPTTSTDPPNHYPPASHYLPLIVHVLSPTGTGDLGGAVVPHRPGNDVTFGPVATPRLAICCGVRRRAR